MTREVWLFLGFVFFLAGAYWINSVLTGGLVLVYALNDIPIGVVFKTLGYTFFVLSLVLSFLVIRILYRKITRDKLSSAQTQKINLVKGEKAHVQTKKSVIKEIVQKRTRSPFQRWVFLLVIIAFGLFVISGVQLYFSSRAWTEYSRINNNCNDKEMSLLTSSGEWVSQGEEWWQENCSASNEFSEWTRKYKNAVYTTDAFETTLGSFGFVFFIIFLSYIARWIFKGRFLPRV